MFKTLSFLLLIGGVRLIYSCQTYEFGIFLGYNEQFGTSYLFEEEIHYHINVDDAIKQIKLDLIKQRKYQVPALFVIRIDQIVYYENFFNSFEEDLLVDIYLPNTNEYLVVTKKK